MIEMHTPPAGTDVTNPAVRAGLDVGGTLACTYDAVVAFDAGPSHPTMIEDCIAKAMSTVAVVAMLGAADMGWRLARCLYPVMTAFTGLRCPLELATDMAPGALNPLVKPGQRKACVEMIEATAFTLGRHWATTPDQKEKTRHQGDHGVEEFVPIRISGCHD